MEKVIYNMVINFDDRGNYREHLVEDVIEHRFDKRMGDLIVKIVYIKEGKVCTSDEKFSLGTVKNKFPRKILKDDKILPIQLTDLEKTKWENTGKRIRFFGNNRTYGGRRWQTR